MQITKRNQPDEKQWKGKCRVCNSEAIAKTSELTHVEHDFRENLSFSWEVCPVCGAGDPISGYGGMLFESR